MKQLKSLVLSLLAFAPIFLLAQTGDKIAVPRFEKIPVGETGAHVYMPKGASAFELSLSEDQSEVYTSEVEVDGYGFGAIVVRFVPTMADQTPDDMEGLLESYLEFLQNQFGVTESAGVGKGHTKESVPDARGMIDYWYDAEGAQFAVKGWVDQRFLCVLYLYGPNEYPYFNAQDMYLNGFRFPGE